VCINLDSVLVWMDNVGNVFMYAIMLLGHFVCLLCDGGSVVHLGCVCIRMH
jgi:hypothetical protein